MLHEGRRAYAEAPEGAWKNVNFGAKFYFYFRRRSIRRHVSQRVANEFRASDSIASKALRESIAQDAGWEALLVKAEDRWTRRG